MFITSRCGNAEDKPRQLIELAGLYLVAGTRNHLNLLLTATDLNVGRKTGMNTKHAV
jgi:hypothetical protein